MKSKWSFIALILLSLVMGESCQAILSDFAGDLNAYRKAGLESYLGTSGALQVLIKDPNKMDPTSLITVRAVDSGGRPVPYCRIVFVARDENTTRSFHDAATNKDGYAYCDVIGKTFSINAHLYEFVPNTKARRSQHQKIGKLYSAENDRLVKIAWNPFPTGPGRLEGRVHDQHGRPLTNFILTLKYLQGVQTDWSESYSTYQSVPFRSADGHFELEGLAPRTYSYMVRAEDYSAYVWDFDMGHLTIPETPNSVLRTDIEVEAKQLLYGQAFYDDGQPVHSGSYRLWFEKYSPEKRLKFHTGGRSYGDAIDPNGLFRIGLSMQERRELFECTGGYASIGDRSGTLGKVHVDKLSAERIKAPTLFFARRCPRDSLVRARLPSIADNRMDFDAKQIKGRRVLICFFDMEQRPSRKCIVQLARKVEQLKLRGIAVVAVQTLKVNDQDLSEWIKDQRIPFPVVSIQKDQEAVQFRWAVKSLPWLILTDKTHIVQAEGLTLDELLDKTLITGGTD